MATAQRTGNDPAPDDVVSAFVFCLFISVLCLVPDSDRREADASASTGSKCRRLLIRYDGSRGPMKLAINLLNFGECATVDNFRRWVDFAEEHFDALLISDHIAVTPDVASRYPAPFVDPFVLLAWAASKTSRIEIGTTVTIVPYRHPLHTARLVANV